MFRSKWKEPCKISGVEQLNMAKLYRIFAISCFFGEGSQNFPLKNFSCEVNLGVMYTEYLHFGGVQMGSIGQKWGGHHLAPEGQKNWYTPPTPRMILTPSLKISPVRHPSDTFKSPMKYTCDTLEMHLEQPFYILRHP